MVAGIERRVARIAIAVIVAEGRFSVPVVVAEVRGSGGGEPGYGGKQITTATAAPTVTTTAATTSTVSA